MSRVLAALLSLALVMGLAASDADAKKRRYKKKQWSYKATVVNTDLGLPVGSIVIVNDERKLYYVLGDGQSKQYRVAVGERIELWTGRTFVSGKKVDPDWHPVDGKPPVEGGNPGNPLGKRALYLDWSLLRIHGTPSRGSIGAAVSNGCIRMYNEDVIDLYDRVHVGAPVIAVNSVRDIPKFRDAKFTGKLPAWAGQLELWKEREKLEALERQRAAREGDRSVRFARR